MPPSKFSYDLSQSGPSLVLREDGIESGFIGTLQGLKYEYRSDITNSAALEQNFREKFEALNRVRLTDSEFARLLGEIVTDDVFTAAKTLRGINSFTRDDGQHPLEHRLVPHQPRRPHRRANSKARSPQDPQERPDAAAFPIFAGG
jgi:type I restriction enzyme, R subunit